MTITKRTLERWRKEALELRNLSGDLEEIVLINSLTERILRLTQVLLDQHLIRRKS